MQLLQYLLEMIRSFSNNSTHNHETYLLFVNKKKILHSKHRIIPESRK